MSPAALIEPSGVASYERQTLTRRGGRSVDALRSDAFASDASNPQRQKSQLYDVPTQTRIVQAVVTSANEEAPALAPFGADPATWAVWASLNADSSQSLWHSGASLGNTHIDPEEEEKRARAKAAHEYRVVKVCVLGSVFTTIQLVFFFGWFCIVLVIGADDYGSTSPQDRRSGALHKPWAIYTPYLMALRLWIGLPIGTGYSRIFPWLYVGDFAAASDEDTMLTLRVTHLWTCAAELPELRSNGFVTDKIYLKAKLEHSIAAHWHVVFSSLDRVQTCRGCAFLYCTTGGDRSAAVVVAYLMFRWRILLGDAFYFVILSRPTMMPSRQYMVELARYEVSTHATILPGATTNHRNFW